MKTHMTVPIFIPHLGCPHACVFCNQRSVTNVQAAPSPESVAFSVGEYLSKKGEKTAEIAFFGGSFTGLPQEEQAAYLHAVQPFLESGEAESIRVSTRPDCIDKETVSFLKSMGVKTVELGAQSMSEAVLLASGRGHTPQDTVQASEEIRKGGLTLGLQMMTGLPASTSEAEAETARQFVTLGANIARIYPTAVFCDTPLAKMLYDGQYAPPTMEETVSRAARALEILENGGVQVIRIGLQETETLGRQIVAGAYHPAMGELVRARLWRERLEKAIEPFSGKAVTVYCEKRLRSLLVGQKRENFIYISKKHRVSLSLKDTEEGCFLLCHGEKVAVEIPKRKEDQHD